MFSEIKIQVEIPSSILSKMEVIENNGYECYIVGGASLHLFGYHVLHCENHKELPKDYDLFCSCTGEELLKLFPKAKPIGGQDRLERIFTIITKDGVEISSYRSGGKREKLGNNIYDHLKTCDFSLNAIAIRSNGDCILPKEVINHINKRKLVSMGSPIDRINEDNNRVMRGFRFTGKYNLYIEPKLYKVLQNTDLSKIPMENIRDEFFKLLPYPHGLNAFIASGKFFELFPEMKQMINLYGRSDYHEEDVWDHSLTTYIQMSKLTDDPILLFTALFHDYGKLYTKDSEGRFIKHDEIGSEKLQDILTKLKIKTKDQKRILWLVKNHMWVLNGESKKRKKWFRFFNSMEDSGSTYSDFMFIRYADHISKKLNGSYLHKNESTMNFYEFIKSNVITEWVILYTSGQYPKRTNNLNINGNDIISLGIPPGPKIGLILNKLYEMVIADELPNIHDKLIDQVKKWIK
jgi:tRNA nucleotidyltransferase (CCA-adding enzyme)